ncbi:MAG: hypothetical protein IJT16_04785 [Lachnospiraceae bacterium]|nr:hypothetical protein [Lachnospiraceae bacterium]
MNDKVILVADGLGGAAAIRHQKITPELFDPERIAEVLFPDFCGEACNPEFVRYVEDSFFELFAVKDCYTDNINNIKKSGYFASRLVAAILLYTVLYKESLYSADNLIEGLALKTGEEKDRLLKEAGEFFKGTIQDELRKCAKRANLIYESAYSGLALLGTTLCMTMFREKDGTVQAVCLTAGDSRPYMWNEKEGLCQLLPDEEGPDGGMTNYILANEDADFSVRCDYFEFAKPCILFNASDGCFDSGYFLSPMAFEKLILDTALESGSPEEMGGRLAEIFREYGRHDDSSTIAMRMFGYESFEALKESAGKRFSALEEVYLSKLPGLIEEDYRKVIENENDLPEESSDEAEDGDPEAFLKANLQEALFKNYELSYGRYMMP